MDVTGSCPNCISRFCIGVTGITGCRCRHVPRILTGCSGTVMASRTKSRIGIGWCMEFCAEESSCPDMARFTGSRGWYMRRRFSTRDLAAKRGGAIVARHTNTGWCWVNVRRTQPACVTRLGIGVAGIACGSREYVIRRRKRRAFCKSAVVAGRADRPLCVRGVIFGTQERSKHTRARSGVLVARFTCGGIRGDVRRDSHAPRLKSIMTRCASSRILRMVVGDVDQE